MINRDFVRTVSHHGTDTVDRLAASVGRLMETTVRLGITGLRRSGKTVLVTSLIDNLLKAGRLPLLDVVASDRFLAARLRDHQDQTVPRFRYEEHLAALSADRPEWPAPTKGVSQMRLTIRLRPSAFLRRRLSPLVTVNLDLVDYPGEWLLDLPMLTQDFVTWSDETLALARQPERVSMAGPWLDWLANTAIDGDDDETVARQGHALYVEYLGTCRSSDTHLSLLQPGRFLEAGDLAGAPVLTFCPLPGSPHRPRRGSLRSLMESRFEAYKHQVVGRFFRDQFARLDRQIVLVDVLSSLSAGAASLGDLRRAITTCLEAFRYGSGSWLERLAGRRIDRVLFAATKADHIATSQHANLRATLDQLVGDAKRDVKFEGATTQAMAIAALKCTRTVKTEHQGRQLACVEGTPVGRDAPTVLFPGEILDPHEPFPAGIAQPYRFLDFRPPLGVDREGLGLPNIRLDQTMQFLLGDYLA